MYLQFQFHADLLVWIILKEDLRTGNTDQRSLNFSASKINTTIYEVGDFGMHIPASYRRLKSIPQYDLPNRV